MDRGGVAAAWSYWEYLDWWGCWRDWDIRRADMCLLVYTVS